MLCDDYRNDFPYVDTSCRNYPLCLMKLQYQGIANTILHNAVMWHDGKTLAQECQMLTTPFHAQSMEINIEHLFQKLNAFRCKIYYYWLTEHFVWRHSLTHANKYMPEYKTNPAPLSALQSLTISFRSIFLV